ncbi:IclR family transcriptional regulator [Herbiconiux sp. KACC 21604]|uniref:IclR family transcriptional regulator n=1 Tax=unclassified Herbiconiux TaxID=2618217 RepID=UPI001491E986|nr:IclR family transcriptional regulator [Herbiconiux sp. SALV-R1]QJU55291.1 IclR family transcriptional regulator [Herbiconiux sp. SALV-R1]WPO86458.1 IclR family transcriptional regulator [Herbiconiux sp. KACC 21604]
MTDSDSLQPNDPTDRYTLRSVSRALRLLDLLGEAGGTGFTVTELSAQLGASKSATFALLRTLVAQSYVSEVQPGPRYRLGRAVIRLADSLNEGLGLMDVCRPVMHELTARTGWTTRLAVADEGHPVFIDRVDGPGTIRFTTQLGRREFPHHSAAGKALLSTLSAEQVARIAAENGLPERTRHTITDVSTLMNDLSMSRERGYAIDDEEDDEGVYCVGAAFLGRDGSPLGSISITGLKRDITTWRARELGELVREHADKISNGFGGPSWQEYLLTNPPANH